MGKKLDEAVDKVQQTSYEHPYGRADFELRLDPQVNGPFLDEVQTGHENARRKGDSVNHLIAEGKAEQVFRARETKGDREAANPAVRREAQKKSDAAAKKTTTKKAAAKKAPGKKK